MIYTPGDYDGRLLSFSRELIRASFRLLRNSDNIARAQRERDALTKAAPAFGEGEPD
ncbi:hypothetical protein [Bradyrhizobium liaoningense]|uniref:hypothetical protein n=1 Tax=Bradyrhizobium liaoningense TaxID=43992 RepID=UPI001BA96A15|nr:hypothetical protein [Bradyrhizobium liaoningense]MBR0719576.1 hypothetical protein [Bradyrhizobium liaoningense]